MSGAVTEAETPSVMLWRLARLKLAFRSALREELQWEQTKKPLEREPRFPHLEQVWDVWKGLILITLIPFLIAL